jgi:hypothetical protein
MAAGSDLATAATHPVPAWRRPPSPSLAEAVRLGDELVDAWGSWAPTLSPDCTQMAFVSDRTGSPRLFVQDLRTGPDAGGVVPTARTIELSEDPVVSVSWSADGGWLACAVATGGGVRTQVWVVRPDGSDARRIAGSESVHAELGPWTRSGHRVSLSIPAEHAGEPTRAYLVDPANGEMYALAEGDLISVLDLSVDEDYVVLKDGQRGRQFCVVVDRVADADHPLLPYPATGSTDRAIVRPAPPGDPLPPDHPAGPSGIARSWRRGSPACSRPGPTRSSRGWTPTTRAICCSWSGTSPAAAPSSSSSTPGPAGPRSSRTSPGR